MQKFLSNRETLCYCITTGKRDLEKEDYVRKEFWSGETFFVLPNGHRHGPSEEKCEDEILHCLWKDGELHGPWTFEKDGQIEGEGNYEHGKKIGPERRYHNGVICSHKDFLDDKIHGLFVVFWRSGKLNHIAEYASGKKHGLEAHFNNEGSVMRVYENRDGEQTQLPFEVCFLLLKKIQNLLN
ncbi:hypothetical protein [Brazilian marseillevirus]|uniref:hypothetical protein n=1 Tax=Brazilian marseillevirus TaxID=1813599 RepID=UPI0007807B0D|nr:hypothetical protein A3303_gp188 [Brazilian marseillevirus]AMQ10696.1 hypothetical protein [Brazilian marseillevirus]